MLPLLLFANIGPSKESLAGDWVNSYAIDPSRWQGSLTQLQAYIADASNNCGNYVHATNKLHNVPNSVAICRSKLNARYADTLNGLQGEQKSRIDELQNSASGNTRIYWIVALVVILLIVLLLIL